ncbi:hypothetical protein B0J14DRAFT_640926 [Halenospora varia]|nr:hypothetical protein B0J14DRAFT_640926 [Halenospora varia]
MTRARGRAREEDSRKVVGQLGRWITRRGGRRVMVPVKVAKRSGFEGKRGGRDTESWVLGGTGGRVQLGCDGTASGRDKIVCGDKGDGDGDGTGSQDGGETERGIGKKTNWCFWDSRTPGRSVLVVGTGCWDAYTRMHCGYSGWDSMEAFLIGEWEVELRRRMCEVSKGLVEATAEVGTYGHDDADAGVDVGNVRPCVPKNPACRKGFTVLGSGILTKHIY